MANLFTPELTVGQSFARVGKRIRRTLTIGRKNYSSFIRSPQGKTPDASRAWGISYLQGGSITYPETSGSLSMVDLFCGGGGLTYGIRDAGRAIGIDIHPRVALDLDEEALAIYQRNIGVDAPLMRDVTSIIDYHVNGSGADARFSYKPKILDSLVADLAHGTDLLVAGPPCEGHSNLNNRTRRADARNLLYLTAPAFAIATRAGAVVIENVPDVLSDKHNVIASARALFAKSGYSIDEAVLSGDRFGLAQTRRRHFLVAVRNPKIEFDLAELARGLQVSPLVIGHVLKDLLGKEGRTHFHSAAKIAEETKRRINWLFDEDEHDLPNHARPPCHQNGHNYKSVYGRLKWNEPSGTITTGFLSPGRGRYVHPKERRGLTLHEGARLQGFPDSFAFVEGDAVPSNKAVSKAIGDAVPPRLGCVVGLIALALLQHG